MQRRLT